MHPNFLPDRIGAGNARHVRDNVGIQKQRLPRTDCQHARTTIVKDETHAQQSTLSA